MFGGYVWLKSDRNRRADITDIQQSRTVALWIEKVGDSKKLQISDRGDMVVQNFNFARKEPKTLNPKCCIFGKKFRQEENLPTG